MAAILFAGVAGKYVGPDGTVFCGGSTWNDEKASALYAQTQLGNLQPEDNIEKCKMLPLFDYDPLLETARTAALLLPLVGLSAGGGAASSQSPHILVMLADELQSGGENQQLQAVSALAQLSAQPQHAAAIVENGCVNPLLAKQTHEDTTIGGMADRSWIPHFVDEYTGVDFQWA